MGRKLYPWIGDSSAVLDLAATGASFPTVEAQAQLPFVCDRTGAYGGAYACVKVGATGGTVSKTLATARADPFPTLPAALSAIQTFNNTNSGHNDIGGGIAYLMDANGAAATHTNDSCGVGWGTAWCEVRPDPANTGAVTLQWPSGFCFGPSHIRYGGGLKIVAGASYFILTNDSDHGDVAFGGVTGSNHFASFLKRWWGCNLTFINDLPNGMFVDALNTLVGVVATTTNTSTGVHLEGRNVIGCDMLGVAIFGPNISSGNDPADGRIIYNNRILASASDVMGDPIVKGVVWAQNIIVPAVGVTPFSPAQPGSGVTMVTWSADSEINPVNNFLEFHNLLLSERGNRLYNDSDGSAVGPSGLKKRGFSFYNVWNNWNWKADAFNGSALRGRVGNWEYGWNVGCLGNISVQGSKDGTTPAVSAHYLGEYWEPGSLYCAATQATIPTYVNDQQGVSLGGDYHLIGSTNSAYSRVPAGRAVLKYDLSGTARKNDGTGAAGPYERTL